MKLKGLHFTDVAEIQEAETDELKKVHKDEISAKPCIYANGAYFEIKKKMSSSRVFDFFKKKISPKTFGPQCVFI